MPVRVSAMPAQPKAVTTIRLAAPGMPVERHARADDCAEREDRQDFSPARNDHRLPRLWGVADEVQRSEHTHLPYSSGHFTPAYRCDCRRTYASNGGAVPGSRSSAGSARSIPSRKHTATGPPCTCTVRVCAACTRVAASSRLTRASVERSSTRPRTLNATDKPTRSTITASRRSRLIADTSARAPSRAPPGQPRRRLVAAPHGGAPSVSQTLVVSAAVSPALMAFDWPPQDQGDGERDHFRVDRPAEQLPPELQHPEREAQRWDWPRPTPPDPPSESAGAHASARLQVSLICASPARVPCFRTDLYDVRQRKSPREHATLRGPDRNP
jgi:hypothetical protein